MKLLIFDLDGVLFDTHGREEPYEEVSEILNELRPEYKCILLTAGISTEQMKKLEHCGIEHCFSDIYIVPTGEEKADVLSTLYINLITCGGDPADCVVIGDRVDLEIKYGNTLGFATIRVKRGKYKDVYPCEEFERPQFIILSLRELPPLIAAM